MTRPKTWERFTLLAGQRRTATRVEKLRLPAIPGVVVLFCVVAVITASAQNVFFTTLVNFDGTNGSGPGSLIQASDGQLYGTTVVGGTSNNCTAMGCGTVVKITPAGALTTLYSFGGSDGANPQGLVQARDGNFYGTTSGGGAYNSGTVFRITSAGALTTLYSFCSQPNCADGSSPLALIQASDGSFYGMSQYGGSDACGTGTLGCGTLFKITPSGAFTTLYTFCSQTGCADGALPSAGLVQATDGNFYGLTSGGGNPGCAYGCGTVFQIGPAGTLTTLYDFCSEANCSDGDLPAAGLMQASNGNFYGTTCAGGASGVGTAFSISSSGSLTTLHSFNGGDGECPSAALVQASDGNFYGTTPAGGNHIYGTVFKMTTSGALTTLHNFCASGWPCTDGARPYGALVELTNGFFYGTTSQGGTVNDCDGTGCGTVFRMAAVRAYAIRRP